MIHVTIQQLSSYLDDQLAENSAGLVRQHLAACPECESKLEALSRMDAALTRALTHEPGEDLYPRLEREIAAALGPDPKAAAAENLAPEPPAPTPRAETPPSPAAAPRQSTVAAHSQVPATAWTPRTSRRPAHATKEPPRSRGSSAGTWVVIFSLALIAGSAGVVVSHSGTVQGWLDSLVSKPNFTVGDPSPDVPSPETAAATEVVGDSTLETADHAPLDAAAPGSDAGTQGPAPAAPGITTTPPDPRSPAPAARLGASIGHLDPAEDDWDHESSTAEDGPAPQTMRADEVMASMGAAPGASPGSGRTQGGSRRDDPFANLRPEAQASVREAERFHQEILFHPTAEQFEMAALRWERALEGMSGPEQVTVRGRLADARYRAWEAGPTPERADAAITAIRSYLLFAPPGIAREEAKARLERLTPR